jgi:hypothetical protein
MAKKPHDLTFPGELYLILRSPLTRQGSPLRWVQLCLYDISAQSHPKLSSDAAGGLYDAGTVDQKAIRRAALITLRRAICERFPAGRERQRPLLRTGRRVEPGCLVAPASIGALFEVPLQPGCGCDGPTRSELAQWSGSELLSAREAPVDRAACADRALPDARARSSAPQCRSEPDCL